MAKTIAEGLGFYQPPGKRPRTKDEDEMRLNRISRCDRQRIL
jgi:hypothetical protein